MAVLDSGNRREFETGAVRDIHEGKGRCDLLPLDVIGDLMLFMNKDHHYIFTKLGDFQRTGNVKFLHSVLEYSSEYIFESLSQMLLETSHQFEDGAVKYGDNNWRKGMYTNIYLDCAVRHLLKHMRGDIDERHDRSFVWNILCLIWTHKNRENMRTIPFKECEDLLSVWERIGKK